MCIWTTRVGGCVCSVLGSWNGRGGDVDECGVVCDRLVAFDPSAARPCGRRHFGSEQDHFFIIMMWISGLLAEKVLETSTWQFGVGVRTIVYPVAAVSLIV
ncbi:hypothetical protein BJ742DRAFT_844502 [Cladochytrium replicatum]|nr:hypothetical protein BJ742DRAFT_844502 [Cladochytrium replicatum]